MSGGISRDEWLRALADIGESEEDDQGALTTDEFMATIGMDRQRARRQLEKLVVFGKAVRTRKLARTGDGRKVHMIAYRLL